MNEPRKSDSPVVPVKSSNNAGPPAAEGAEGSGLTKGNLPQQNARRIQRRESAPSALERVRQAAARDKKMRFTALLHHIYHLETLRAAYFSLKREAVAGVDGETWRHYGERLEENLCDLAARGQAWSVSGKASTEGVHSQDRRAATTARRDGTGR
jgi:RNA-directed DNA polymerase